MSPAVTRAEQGADALASTLEILRRGDWFAGLGEPLQREIVRRSIVRRFRPGQYLVREGDPPRALIAVLDGQVRVVRRVGDDDEVLMALGSAGVWVSDFPVLYGRRSLGSVIADVATCALVLPHSAFEAIVEADPAAYRRLVMLSADRYEMLYRYAAEARSLSPEAWLHSRLVDLARLQGVPRGRTSSCTLSVTQQELATMVGLSRQTVSKLLGHLHARGLVEVGFRSIRVTTSG